MKTKQEGKAYPLATSTWDSDEYTAIHEVVASGRFTMGERVRAFEVAFAEQFGARYAVMVNSGSSANLLAVSALRYVKDRPLVPGSEVIVPAVSWGTTYYPWTQHGMRLRFVDIDPATLNLDIEKVEEAITENTAAICAVNLLGAPNHFEPLLRICEHHGLQLFEDNCEGLGASYQDRPCGSFGRCGTFSTFFSHHICTMEGGVVVTDDKQLYHTMLAMRAHGWTRDLPAGNEIAMKSGSAFHDAFHFVLPGYNLRPTELAGAIGLQQLRKLDQLLAQRRVNAEYFVDAISPLDGVAVQRVIGNGSWFGFAIILEGALAGQRDAVVADLMCHGIECRPIVAGNFVRHPVIHHLPHSISGTLDNADRVHNDGFFVGNNHNDIRQAIDHLGSRLKTFL